MASVAYYSDQDDAPEKKITVDLGPKGARYRVYLLDKDHSGEETGITGDLTFTLKVNTALFLEEI